jgi:hypothetical protein
MVSKLAVRLESLALDLGIQKSNALYLGNADYFDRMVVLEERMAPALALRFSRSFERRFKAERGPYNEVRDLVRRHLDSVVVRLAPEPTRFGKSFMRKLALGVGTSDGEYWTRAERLLDRLWNLNARDFQPPNDIEIVTAMTEQIARAAIDPPKKWFNRIDFTILAVYDGFDLLNDTQFQNVPGFRYWHDEAASECIAWLQAEEEFYYYAYRGRRRRLGLHPQQPALVENAKYFPADQKLRIYLAGDSSRDLMMLD